MERLPKICRTAKEIQPPMVFASRINRLWIADGQMIAFVYERRLNDQTAARKILLLLNQLCRYYQRPVTIYCLSYRTVCSQEAIWTCYRQKPVCH